MPAIEMNTAAYQLFGATQSASEIGGDFFEVIEHGDNKLLLAIGDVSGHNIAAGLLMAITKGAFRTAMQHTKTLERLVESMNQTVLENSDKKMFVSLKCGQIDLSNNALHVVNAGHLPLLHYQKEKKRVVEWNTEGLALGLSATATYKAHKIPYQKGDLFVFITDGIVEASGVTREEFGFKRVRDTIEQLAVEASPEQIHEALGTRLRAFIGTTTLKDDVTFLGLKIV